MHKLDLLHIAGGDVNGITSLKKRMAVSFLKNYHFVVQSQSCFQLCDPVNCSMPDYSILHYLLEFAQTHVHEVGDAI